MLTSEIIEELKDIIYRTLIGQYEKGDIIYKIQQIVKNVEEENLK